MSAPAAIAERALVAIAAARDEAELERLRVEFLGSKSELMAIPRTFGSLPREERSAAGQAFNAARSAIADALGGRSAALARARLEEQAAEETIDVTFPGRPPALGRLHVLTRLRREIETVLETLGYQAEPAREVETDWYDQEALNVPRDHAWRDLREGFRLAGPGDLVLRSDLSSMLVRAMERLREPPIRAFAAGPVYRRDGNDPARPVQSLQVEALAIDEGLSVADLKGTLLYVAESLWGEDRPVRLRPAFIAHAEPGFELDVGAGDGWVVAGAGGIVHPGVLRNGGLDPERWSGISLDVSVERAAALRYDVEDLRLFGSTDLRLLEQLG